MYLNHDQIEELVDAGWMLDVDRGCVNAASLDVRLGNTILVENGRDFTQDGKVYPVGTNSRAICAQGGFNPRQYLES